MFYQNGVGGYTTCIDTHPQKQIVFNDIPQNIPERDTNSFHENVQNNGMTTRLMTYTQNDSHGIGCYHPQQLDLNNFPQHQIPGREVESSYNHNNTNSFNENIRNNMTTMQDVSITDINSTYNNNKSELLCNDHQGGNGVGDSYA